ncbi:MAG: lysoplasmalogenase [Actinobacteria bacterium]|nr:lysoplasmalogenase [Actinomycetota bacterium]
MEVALVAAVAVSLAVTLVGERTREGWRVWPKAAASAGYLALALASGASDTTYGRWVLAALALAWVGDVALSIDLRPMFAAGLGAFLAAHVAFLGAFGDLGIRAIAAVVAAGILAAVAAAVGRWLLPHVPRGLRPPVIAYLVVITAMVAAAVGASSGGAPWPVLTGASLFYVSDLFVARDQFVARGFDNRIVGLPLYYAAQVLFALSVGMV